MNGIASLDTLFDFFPCLTYQLIFHLFSEQLLLLMLIFLAWHTIIFIGICCCIKTLDYVFNGSGRLKWRFSYLEVFLSGWDTGLLVLVAVVLDSLKHA